MREWGIEGYRGVRETEEGRKTERVRINDWVGLICSLGLLVWGTWYGKRQGKRIVWA
jgi:hypothetical protein